MILSVVANHNGLFGGTVKRLADQAVKSGHACIQDGFQGWGIFHWKIIIYEIPRVKTTTNGKNSFKYTATVLWNDLPEDFRKILTNLRTFYYLGMEMNANVMHVKEN